MEIILGCCAGLDVHKDSVEACVRSVSAGGKIEHEVRHWGTTTGELVAMADWLSSFGVTHVAMESTGVYWKPIFNILEARFEILLAKRPSPEERSRAQDRHPGLSVDRAVAAARVAQGQFHSATATAGVG